MKKILLILILISNNIFSQTNAVVEYSYEYKDMKTDNIDKNKILASSFNKSIAQYAKAHKYILKFTPNESYYEVITSLKPDNIDEKTYDMSTKMFRGGVFYQNKMNKYILNQKKTYSGELYLIKDTLINDWKISNKTKLIGKYKCYKATKKLYKNQIITAWFTPVIPVPFGPVGYGGLPGLILEINYLNNSLILKNIKFKNNKIEIFKPKEGKFVTKKEYKKIRLERRGKLYEKYMRHKR